MSPFVTAFQRWCTNLRRGPRPRGPEPAAGGRAFRPGVHPLEDRALPSTFTVLNLNDAGPGSLRAAVAAANANPGADTVVFSPAARGTITVASQLAITDDLAIRGPGADRLTVSGGGTTRVFAVLPAALAGNPFATPTLAQVAASPEVTIEGLTVSGGRATDALGFDPASPANPGFAFGGGLYNLGGTVRLDRVRMAGNQAVGFITAGGAVANEFGGTLTVSRSSFENNTSDGFLIGAGGAITSDLGPTADGTPTRTPTVGIDRSTFTGNRALAQAGYIDGAAFSGLGGGGAILNLTGEMTITRSEFANNAARGGTVALPGVVSGGPGFGGAVLTGNASPFGVGPSRLDVSRSTFVGNTATGGVGAAGLPGGEGAGGAVAVTNGSAADLGRNTFRDNTAAGGAGGANARGGNATGGAVSVSGGGVLTTERNTFTGNVARGGPGTGTGAAGTGRGGALGLYDVTLAGFSPGVLPNAEVSRDLIAANQAVGGLGGGVYNEGDLTVRDAVITGNRAVSLPGGQGIGGGLYNLGTVDLIDTLILGNFASTSNDDLFGV
ncbi:MAG: hypothetical protein C0501_23935 [Isosphaera sp.]|nr:hypothetical protein [Isosphaera sp.]